MKVGKNGKKRTGRENRNQGTKEEWALDGGKTKGEQKPSEKNVTDVGVGCGQ